MRCTPYPTSLMLLVVLAQGVALAQVGDVRGVHDPTLIRAGERYYLFSTGRGIPVRTSLDLKTWRFEGPVLAELPTWARQHVPEARDCWAPDIVYFAHKFHLYYSISTFGKNRSCIGLLTNTTLDRHSPDYAWQDQGLVMASEPGRDDFNAIDPHVVLDADGIPWLSFGSFWSGIKLVRLNLQTGKPEGPLQHIAGRGGGAIEAPFIVRQGEFYYLFVSFDQCCRGIHSTYKIMVGRAPQVIGPYVDRTGRPLTEGGGTVVLESAGDVIGPGHNAVLRDATGDYLVYHYYDRRQNGRPTLQIRSLTWDAEAWPVAGAPLTPP